MAPPDYTNWQQEREKLKQEILTDLRKLRDKGSYQLLKGVYTFNIQGLFKEVGDMVIVGPIMFKTAYRNAPVVTFGPQFFNPTYPFNTHISIAKWHIDSGTIDGFFMAVYALTVPSPLLDRHSIHWQSTGIGSAYRREQSADNWQVPYDRNYSQATLVQDDRIDSNN